jgi:ATP-dependent DNA helicase RecG
VLDADPRLAAHPALAAAVRRRLDDETSEYLSRG